ncbi:MAG: UDP-N-acetylmuramoylalanyl-D-glutamyl-2,6-diaminopimelate--D-alanyl-D-alanine ligase [Alphaproteobacteria bacterium]
MTHLWTETDSAEATRGRATGPFHASGVSIDTRNLKPGDLFVALRGNRNDGHDHLIAARDAGAAAAMVDTIPKDAPSDLPCLVVDDTLAALNDLAKAARSRLAGKVIGVTGSVGKTGAKDGLAHVLAPFGSVHKNIGNLNNQFGCPLTLARMPADTDFAIIEMGMNHAGEISPLSKLARPNVVLITNVDAVHLEFFDSVEGIADAKAEIFDGVAGDGVAVLNRDNPYYRRLADKATAAGIGHISTFGEDAEATFRLKSYTSDGSTSEISANCAGKSVSYRLGAAGRHLALNSLGILAVISALGIDVEQAAKQFETLTANPGRGGRYTIKTRGGSVVLIDESYNASPASTAAALQVLGDIAIEKGGRRIAVLGDMRELGENAAEFHTDLAKTVNAAKIDLVFTAGPLMMGLFEALPKARRGGHAATSGEILPLVTASVRAGDVVTVKGSLGSRMKPVVDALRALDRSGLDDDDEQASPSVNGGCA